jgi:hypothetical protein
MPIANPLVPARMIPRKLVTSEGKKAEIGDMSISVPLKVLCHLHKIRCATPVEPTADRLPPGGSAVAALGSGREPGLAGIG